MSSNNFNSSVDPVARRTAGALKWTRYDADVLPAWIAETDFSPPMEVLEAIRSVADTELVGYTGPENRLIRACVNWMRKRHDWIIDPDLVIPLTDVMQGVEAAVTAFSRSGDAVVVTTPVYHPFFEVSPSAGRRQIEWRLRRDDHGWHFDVDDLERVLQSNTDASVLLLSHPHNPTGRVMDAATMADVVATAAAHDVMIVSDEIHGDLTYPGPEFRSMLSVEGAADRVVVSTSAAKTFAISGLRASVLVFGSHDVMGHLKSAHPRMLLGHPGRPGADATTAAWEHGSPWADGLLEHLGAMRTKLIDRLARQAPAVRFHPPEATFLAWLDLEACGLGESPAEHLVDVARVAVQEGSVFGTGSRHHVRLNFGTSEALLDEILDRLIPHLQS